MAENKLQKWSIHGLLNEDAVKKRFTDVLGDRAPAFMSSIISAVAANPDLGKCEPGTVVAAAAVAAGLNLVITPSLGLAHIVPYKNRAQFQMGWRGYVQLGMRTGQYKTIHASIVYEGELVENNHITGEMVFDISKKISDKIIGYVGYFRLLNGFEKYWYMTREQVEAHGKKYSRAYDSQGGRWQQDFDLMALKTVLKMLLSKYGFLSVEMETAVKADQAIVRGDGTYEYPDNGNHDPDPVEPSSLTPAQRYQRILAQAQADGINDMETIEGIVRKKLEADKLPADPKGAVVYCDELEAEIKKVTESGKAVKK